ncbi:acyltransferase family protein [Dyella subtropica]|uniref:acyltransferase family protein n=1 Tax=Dyella subtropica TaxID=2992127 RepID=UPI00225BE8AC|nr:acyltransferase family protein [Dyella subtropica]
MSTNEYRLGFRGDIEGLRAVAILLVVAAHAGVPWLRGGFVGVDVFFVLSGFLITGLLVREIADSGRVDFVEFYLRRLRRLMPALIVMLLTVCVLASQMLVPGDQWEQAGAAAMASVWLSNIHFALARLDYFAPGAESSLFLHTWSLGVEEQFYLFWPILLLAAFLGGGGKLMRLKAVLLIVFLISMAGCLSLTQSVPQWTFYMMPFRAWQFSVGALVWIFLQRQIGEEIVGPRVSDSRVLYWGGWFGLAAIVGAGLVFDPNTSYPDWKALLPAFGAAGILSAGPNFSALSVPRMLSWRPLQLLGRVSYSWYLWHWPVLLLMRTEPGSNFVIDSALGVLASLAIAIASYQWIENPIRSQQRWLTHRWASLVCVVLISIAANLLMLAWRNDASDQLQRSKTQPYAGARLDTPAIYFQGCDEGYQSVRVHICRFGSEYAKHTAVLFGDSIAGQWFPAMIEVFDKPGWRLLVLTKSACPMVDEPFFYPPIKREFTECSAWRENSLKQIASIKPDVVVLSTTSTPEFTQRQWVDGTSRVLGKISGASTHIYVLRDTPQLPFDGPNCLETHKVVIADSNALLSCTASSKNEHEDLVFHWLQQAASRFTNVTVIDLNDLVCPNGVCSAERQGKAVYRDTHHLTGSFAASLGKALGERLAARPPTGQDDSGVKQGFN